MFATLEDMTIPALRSLADNAGIDLPKRIKKADLVAHIDSTPEGRREFYKLRDRQWAAGEFIPAAMENGTARLECPPEDTNPKVDAYNVKLFHYRVNAVVSVLKQNYPGQFLWTGGGKTDINGVKSAPCDTFVITRR